MTEVQRHQELAGGQQEEDCARSDVIPDGGADPGPASKGPGATLTGDDVDPRWRERARGDVNPGGARTRRSPDRVRAKAAKRTRLMRVGGSPPMQRSQEIDMAFIFGVIYFVLLVTLGIISIRKGHWVMFIIGLFLPLFWIIGALMPSRDRLR